ncbi:T-box transcription factor mls-1-like [Corticium candelabrum]|uniref:T-box transcription factor mls-1-like n=1 Tax=Corticium candelabrum TaxID=121492 RepID=UPI002E275BF8|nr:T-box transcription factor mls-1-like [Corticium candelabrum]
MAAGTAGAFSIASLLFDGKERETSDEQCVGQDLDLPSKCRVELESRDLWQKFNVIGNEMILTKSGRRMFPALRFVLRNLDPLANYELMVGIEPIDQKRYRYCYQRSQWLENPSPEHDDKPSSNASRTFVHPASPATGAYWMRDSVSFEKMKLTNNWKDDGGHIVLQSMHRYRPKLHIVCTDTGEVEDFDFEETAFMAVTAYQNPQITKLKIEGNPFARGFRTLSSGVRDGRGATSHRETCASRRCTEVAVNSWTSGHHPNYSYHFATPTYVSRQSIERKMAQPPSWLSHLSVPPPLLRVKDHHSVCYSDLHGLGDEHLRSPSASPIRGAWLA